MTSWVLNFCYTDFMPHLSGVFDEFPDLDKASFEEIASGLSFKVDKHFLVNYLGNRILYPQLIPITPQELEIDLAILRVGVRLKPGLFFEPQTNRILISKIYEDRFANLLLLVKAIVEGVNPKGVHMVFIKENSNMTLAGSVVSPINAQKLSEDGKTVKFTGLGIERMLPLETITIMQTPVKSAKIKLKDEEYDVAGGRLGILIDLRSGGPK